MHCGEILNVKLAIVYSENDPAGKGVSEIIANYLDAEKAKCPLARTCFVLGNGIYLGGYSEETVNFEFLDKTPDPNSDAIIILSRHSSQKKIKTLTVHHTGNPTSRTLGGRPFTLSYSFPALSKALLISYYKEAKRLGLLDNYDIKLEATHHGPTDVKKPLVFIEIGSSIDEWTDPLAREAMARAVINVIKDDIKPCKPVAGFGGGHYPIKFTKMHLEGEYCFGHIIPKYAFNEGVSPEVIEQSIKRCYPKEAEAGVIEKKSLKSAQRKLVQEILEKLGKEVVLI